MDKTYSPHDIEERVYRAWEQAGLFAPAGEGPPYCIVIPPPNVTGTLHMGHAFQDTIMDALTRFHRMSGDRTLWQPGIDHAGIATQMVVERQLAAEGLSRRELGREPFTARVWQWKDQSGGIIARQMRRLGASVDWNRDRFTMDPGMSRAVLEAFVRLHDEGLIYRGKRLVNWDPVLKTALSDLEVQAQEEDGHLWHIRYPFADGGGHVTVATTRPETLLGDTAVAFHPEDDRHRGSAGRRLRLPLTERVIPMIADEFVDPAFGSGCVKVTPAHDFNDYEVGRRHGLPMINVLTADARIGDGAPARYHGLDRFEARRRIVAELEAAGLLEKVEPHRHTVPRGDRSGAALEPWLTDQWYVRIAPLAGRAIRAVEDGDIRFVPANWDRTYFEWMRNIKDWCISRQLWWGHRIPAWYGPDGAVYVGRSEAEIRRRHGIAAEVALAQDEDVLDTWFSSALWPFSTLGWPDRTPELATFYPTSVLVTGFDIIFFWVARMMMMGLHFMGEVPFREVYIHALVRDEKGAKMSKSKGNVVDPLHVVETYGADALRFTLAAMAAQGRDIKLSSQRIEGYRNFGTKLWNAARFAEMNGCVFEAAFNPRQTSLKLNGWIVGETAKAIAEVTAAIETYRFNDAANAAYRFVWNIFCDWYLELAKPLLQGADGPGKAETRATTAFVREQIIKLLHPFMPFMTEELWAITATKELPRACLLALAEWPEELDGCENPGAEAEIGFIVELISEIRSVRAEMNVPAAAQIPLMLVNASPETKSRAKNWDETIKRLARLSVISFAPEAPEKSVQMIVRTTVAALPLQGIIDFDAEKARLAKEIAKLKGDVDKIEAKLRNADFVARAPEEVVDENRERREDALSKIEKLAAALARLGGG